MSAMLFDLPSDDRLYAALLSRDPAYDGLAYVGVTSTGVFCRLTCPARKPKRENTVFFDSVGGAIAAGFRPCRRCRPLALACEREPLVARLVDLLDRDADRRWSEQDLVARATPSPEDEHEIRPRENVHRRTPNFPHSLRINVTPAS